MRNFVESIAEEYGHRPEPPEIFCSLKTRPSMEELFGSSASTPSSCITPNVGREEEEREMRASPRNFHSGATTPSIAGEGDGVDEMVLSPVSEEAPEEAENGREEVPDKRKPRSSKKSSRTEIQTATKFIWSGPGAQEVYLVGDFTGWKDRVPLEKKGEVFLTTILLDPGFYKFKYVVDGEWKHDGRRRTLTDEHGNVNNVVSVGLKQVKFVWRGGAREVGVTGSFCGWRHIIYLLPCGDERKVAVMIPPGEYEYKLVVDGSWICDPSALSREDGSGNWNSVLKV